MIVQALTDKQRAAILLSRSRKVTIYEGAVRSAKTITSLLDWIALVRTAPPGRLAIIGKTERTLRNNVIGPLQDMLGKRRVAYNRGLGEITMFGRTILVIGANDERASDKIRGVTLAGAYVDEATILPESFWQMLLTRLSVKGSRLLATTNPDSPAHPLKVGYLDRAADHLTSTGSHVQHFGIGWSSSYDIVNNGEPNPDDPKAPLDLCRLSFVIDDNPTLDPDYRKFIRSTYVGLWFKRFILGMWVAAEGAIYDMLTDAHQATAPTTVGQCWLGIDYGTSNPTHAVLLATDWVNGRLHAVAEWRHDGRAQRALTDAELSKQLQTWVGTLKLDHEGITPILDPSAASMRVQMRNDGWHTQPADNRVLDGIRSVSNLLGQNRLVIDTDKCPELWRELQGYSWDSKAQKKGEDKPLKQNDHGCDSLRYACMAAWPVWRTWTSGLQLAA
ncbi:MAG: terminase [Solirubrobacterales bacterium]|nr:terminase [Solirubrobacterales bacterium]